MKVSSVNSQSAIDFHNSISTSWVEKHGNKISFQNRIKAFESLLPRNKLGGSKWLDAGCGTGSMSRLLASYGVNVLGVDGAKGMIENAIQISSEFMNCSFELIDNLDTWQSPGEFNGVLCSSVLEYLENPRQTLNRMAGWISHGGHLLISIPNAYSIIRKTQQCIFEVSRFIEITPRPRYLQFSKHEYSLHAFRILLESLNFELVSYSYAGVPWFGAGFESLLFSPLLIVLARKV